MIRTIALAFILLFTTTTLATAQDKPVLTVYTYDSFAADWGPGPLLKTGFEAQCDCELNFVALPSSMGALRRAQLEGENTKADIILGLDTATIADARETDLFINHKVDLTNLDLPREWTAQDFVPFDYGYFALVYRKSAISEPPTSFQQVARNEDMKIVIQDPRSATPGLGLVLWLKAAYGDDTNEAWPELAKRVVTMTSSWSEAYGLFLADEADMVLSYTTSPAYHLIAEDDSDFAAAEFREGHYMQIEAAGILKSSKNAELANAFLTYLISPDAQAVIPTTNWMYPVIDIPLPQGFETLFEPEKVLLLNEDIVAENAPAWIEEMISAFE